MASTIHDATDVSSLRTGSVMHALLGACCLRALLRKMGGRGFARRCGYFFAHHHHMCCTARHQARRGCGWGAVRKARARVPVCRRRRLVRGLGSWMMPWLAGRSAHRRSSLHLGMVTEPDEIGIHLLSFFSFILWNILNIPKKRRLETAPCVRRPIPVPSPRRCRARTRGCKRGRGKRIGGG